MIWRVSDTLAAPAVFPLMIAGGDHLPSMITTYGESVQ